MSCTVTAEISQDTWHAVVVKYNAQSNAVEIQVDSHPSVNQACTGSVTDRTVSKTYVGKSNWPDAYLNGDIAGLFVVDEYLSAATTDNIVAHIKQSTHLYSLCSSCPAHAQSPAGSSSVMDCVCAPGYSGPDGEACVACDAGTYKEVNGSSACVACVAGKYSAGTGEATESACTLCEAGKYSAGTGKIAESTCNDCPSKSYSAAGSAACECSAGYTAADGSVIVTDKECTNLTIWNCSDAELAKPIQVSKCGTSDPAMPSCPGDSGRSDGVGFFALDVSSGAYAPLMTLATTFDKVACGLSPIDSRVYCVVEIRTARFKSLFYLIRVGSTHGYNVAAPFDFVAKLPGNINYPPNGADFAPGGALHITVPKWGYFADCCGSLWVLDGDNRPDLLQGFADHNDPQLTDLSSLERAGDFGAWAANDVWDARDVGIIDIGGSDIGFTVEHNSGTLWAYKLGPFETKRLQLAPRPGSPNVAFNWKRLSIWVYENRIILTAADGGGVWMPELGDFDLSAAAQDSTIALEYLGPSNALTELDGFNCRAVASPWVLCPANSHSVVAPNFNPTNCKCDPGYTGSDGGLCTSCAAGKYKSGAGSASCTACPNGKYSNATGSSTNQTCMSCPVHADSPVGSTVRFNCTCNTGYLGADGGPCNPCPPGTYEDSNKTCVGCPAGKFHPWNVTDCELSPHAPLTSDKTLILITRMRSNIFSTGWIETRFVEHVSNENNIPHSCHIHRRKPSEEL